MKRTNVISIIVIAALLGQTVGADESSPSAAQELLQAVTGASEQKSASEQHPLSNEEKENLKRFIKAQNPNADVENLHISYGPDGKVAVVFEDTARRQKDIEDGRGILRKTMASIGGSVVGAGNIGVHAAKTYPKSWIEFTAGMKIFAMRQSYLPMPWDKVSGGPTANQDWFEGNFGSAEAAVHSAASFYAFNYGSAAGMNFMQKNNLLYNEMRKVSLGANEVSISKANQNLFARTFGRVPSFLGLAFGSAFSGFAEKTYEFFHDNDVKICSAGLYYPDRVKPEMREAFQDHCEVAYEKFVTRYRQEFAADIVNLAGVVAVQAGITSAAKATVEKVGQFTAQLGESKLAVAAQQNVKSAIVGLALDGRKIVPIMFEGIEIGAKGARLVGTVYGKSKWLIKGAWNMVFFTEVAELLGPQIKDKFILEGWRSHRFNSAKSEITKLSNALQTDSKIDVAHAASSIREYSRASKAWREHLFTVPAANYQSWQSAVKQFHSQYVASFLVYRNLISDMITQKNVHDPLGKRSRLYRYQTFGKRPSEDLDFTKTTALESYLAARNTVLEQMSPDKAKTARTELNTLITNERTRSLFDYDKMKKLFTLTTTKNENNALVSYGVYADIAGLLEKAIDVKWVLDTYKFFDALNSTQTVVDQDGQSVDKNGKLYSPLPATRDDYGFVVSTYVANKIDAVLKDQTSVEAKYLNTDDRKVLANLSQALRGYDRPELNSDYLSMQKDPQYRFAQMTPAQQLRFRMDVSERSLYIALRELKTLADTYRDQGDRILSTPIFNRAQFKIENNFVRQVYLALLEPHPMRPGQQRLIDYNSEATIVPEDGRESHPSSLGYLYTPRMADYMVASAVCGTRLDLPKKNVGKLAGLFTKGNSLSRHEEGYAVEYFPPSLINTAFNTESICNSSPKDKSSFGEVETRFYGVPRAYRSTFDIYDSVWTVGKQNYFGLLDILKQNIRPEFVQNKEGLDVFKKWWQEKVQPEAARVEQWYEREYAKIIKSKFAPIYDSGEKSGTIADNPQGVRLALQQEVELMLGQDGLLARAVKLNQDSAIMDKTTRANFNYTRALLVDLINAYAEAVRLDITLNTKPLDRLKQVHETAKAFAKKLNPSQGTDDDDSLGELLKQLGDDSGGGQDDLTVAHALSAKYREEVMQTLIKLINSLTLFKTDSLFAKNLAIKREQQIEQGQKAGAGSGEDVAIAFKLNLAPAQQEVLDSIGNVLRSTVEEIDSYHRMLAPLKISDINTISK